MYLNMKCQRCGAELQLGSTTNEWKYVCVKCDKRFNEQGEAMDEADKIERQARANDVQLPELTITLRTRSGECFNVVCHPTAQEVAFMSADNIVKQYALPSIYALLVKART